MLHQPDSETRKIPDMTTIQKENKDNRHIDLSFKRFIREGKKSSLTIVDLSFCLFPNFSSLNPIFESIRNRSSRIGNDFVILFSNESSVRWARKNLSRFGRNIIEMKQDEDSIRSWLSEMYYKRNYKNLFILFNESHSLVEQIATKNNGMILDESCFFFFEKIKRINDEYDSILKSEQELIKESLKQKEYFNEFCQTVMNPEIITESYEFFNEFRQSLNLELISKPDLFRKDWFEIESNSDIRESYVSGNLFAIGDEVYLKDDGTKSSYKIKSLGANYVIIESTESGARLKKWLDDVIKKQ